MLEVGQSLFFLLPPHGGCLIEAASFTFGTGGAGGFCRANPTGLLANDLKSEGMAVRIRLSFVSIIAPVSSVSGAQ